jgi:hypothetical protein
MDTCNQTVVFRLGPKIGFAVRFDQERLWARIRDRFGRYCEDGVDPIDGGDSVSNKTCDLLRDFGASACVETDQFLEEADDTGSYFRTKVPAFIDNERISNCQERLRQRHWWSEKK